MLKIRFLFPAVLFLVPIFSFSQLSFHDYPDLFTTPANYTAFYADVAPVIDGNVDDEIWEKVPWSNLFQDIEGAAKPKPYYETRMKMLWDESHLYIAADIKDPHIWGVLTQRDEIVYYDNDFEIFIDPLNTTHNYFEVEINALNTIFDLFLDKPYRNGGAALFSWDTQGMRHAVKINGTVNNPDDIDAGWTVEISIPFRAVTLGDHVGVPNDETMWRINFSRVQWEVDIVDGKYLKRKDANGKILPENNWVWSPQGVINMHCPERWGYLKFSRGNRENTPVFKLPYSEKQKQYLWLVYYKQQDFKRKNNRYALSWKELNIDSPKVEVDNISNELALFSTGRRFEIVIKDIFNKEISINEEGLITYINK